MPFLPNLSALSMRALAAVPTGATEDEQPNSTDAAASNPNKKRKPNPNPADCAAMRSAIGRDLDFALRRIGYSTALLENRCCDRARFMRSAWRWVGA